MWIRSFRLLWVTELQYVNWNKCLQTNTIKSSMRNIWRKNICSGNLKFLEIAEISAVLQDGKYCVKLERVFLPNNFAVAKQRTHGLHLVKMDQQ